MKIFWIIFAIVIVVIIAAMITGGVWLNMGPPPAPAGAVTDSFRYEFRVPGVLVETATMDESSSPYWWLDSGAYMVLASSTGGTVHGDLPQNDRWKLLYAISNPIDTDLGSRPQNIFRMISRNTWDDFRQELYMKVDGDNLSGSPNRNESNGLLLMGRYVDENNLYYAGVRVDGAAVIKKKKEGVYYTLASEKIIAGEYDPELSPNLLPKNVWMGIRMDVLRISSTTTPVLPTSTDASAREEVVIRLYTDMEGKGQWKQAAEAIDDGVSYGGAVIPGPAFVGVRTDFMDVSFRDYEIRKI